MRRRHFLGGSISAGLIAPTAWAGVRAPAFLSAAALPDDGGYVLCGIGAEGDVLFRLPLPARGHAAAIHPTRARAVAFARRPGRFALILDGATGEAAATLSAPQGRHFYGHGCYSRDGRWLYTTENDFEAGRGRIGIWDATKDYARAGEWDSGGIGPHDIKRLPGSETLVVANGGIDTHPDSGRTKLNLPTMRPNLTYIAAGEIVEQMELPGALHRNSIRHLALSATGDVAFAMQWQGADGAPALIGLHRRGQPATLMSSPDAARRGMQGYAGSIAITDDGSRIVATSPRGGRVQIYDSRLSRLIADHAIPDACGAAASGSRFIVTSGNGQLITLTDKGAEQRSWNALHWDNHLIAL